MTIFILVFSTHKRIEEKRKHSNKMAIKFVLVSLLAISGLLNAAKGSLELETNQDHHTELSSREYEALEIIKKLITIIVNNNKCFNDTPINSEILDLFGINASKSVVIKNKKQTMPSHSTKTKYYGSSKLHKIAKNVRDTKEQDSKRYGGGNYADYGTILYIGK